MARQRVISARGDRHGRGGARILIGLALLPFLATPALRAAPSEEEGLVVEVVDRGHGADVAGIRPGDTLVSWSRPASGGAVLAEGRFVSPADLALVEWEQTPLAAVTFKIRREGTELAVTLPPSERFRIRARPPIASQHLPDYERGRALAEGKEIEAGIGVWQGLLAEARAAGDRALSSWLLRQQGAAWGRRKDWGQMEAAFRQALGETQDLRVRAWLRDTWGRGLIAGDQDARNLVVLSEALEECRSGGGSRLVVAHFKQLQGNSSWFTGDLDGAERAYREALAIYFDVAPGGLDTANSLGNLSNVIYDRGDLATAEALLLQALPIQERLSPDGLGMAATLNNLARVLQARGDLVHAEDALRRALRIREASDTVRADLDLSVVLLNLGDVALNQGEIDEAEALFRRALVADDFASKSAVFLAAVLQSLGDVAWRKGDLASAEDHYQRVLAIHEKNNPRSTEVARSLDSLSRVALGRGNLADGQRLVERALEIQQAAAPESLGTGNILFTQGNVLAAAGDLAGAVSAHERALALRGKLAPGSARMAESFVSLGRLAQRSREDARAAELLLRALEVLDQQALRLGGPQEVRAVFSKSYKEVYRETIEVLLKLDRPADAFHVLERSRARAFLALLGERDLVFSADVPAELDGRRRRLDARYDQVQQRIGELDAAKQGSELDALLAQLREVRREQEQVNEGIRSSSPRLASLRQPQPLDLAGVQRGLDPGTVVLSYSVGVESTTLFVVRAPAAGEPPPAVPSVFRIALGERALEQRVRAFHELIVSPAWNAPRLGIEAARLYHELVEPAAPLLVSAKRILICPDGPLHTLPFAALRRPGGYLVEWKPLHVALSATVFVELKRARDEGPAPASQVVAFADPHFPAPDRLERLADGDLKRSLRRGLPLVSLPASRREVEAIAQLFPHTSRVYFGNDATEERAKDAVGQARYVHFATHGLLDEKLPLNSALVLAVPEARVEGADNGLLQVWEILERVRLDASLVTLSACGTGLGKEMGGEGLVGLTRAFQYAGAHSVIASLWDISDRSTAELMKGLYTDLRAGRPKDEALQRAQVAMIRRGAATSHPFRWAAFQLYGDWR